MALWYLPLAASAAPITWGAATNIPGKSQLVEGQVTLAISGVTGATITGGGTGGSSSYVFSAADR